MLITVPPSTLTFSCSLCFTLDWAGGEGDVWGWTLSMKALSLSLHHRTIISRWSVYRGESNQWRKVRFRILLELHLLHHLPRTIHLDHEKDRIRMMPVVHLVLQRTILEGTKEILLAEWGILLESPSATRTHFPTWSDRFFPFFFFGGGCLCSDLCFTTKIRNTNVQQFSLLGHEWARKD